MAQGPLVLLRIEAGHAVGRDLHRKIAVAQARNGVHDADVGADADDHDRFGPQLFQLLGQVGAEEGGVAPLGDDARLGGQAGWRRDRRE